MVSIPLWHWMGLSAGTAEPRRVQHGGTAAWTAAQELAEMEGPTREERKGSPWGSEDHWVRVVTTVQKDRCLSAPRLGFSFG